MDWRRRLLSGPWGNQAPSLCSSSSLCPNAVPECAPLANSSSEPQLTVISLEALPDPPDKLYTLPSFNCNVTISFCHYQFNYTSASPLCWARAGTVLPAGVEQAAWNTGATQCVFVPSWGVQGWASAWLSLFCSGILMGMGPPRLCYAASLIHPQF